MSTLGSFRRRGRRDTRLTGFKARPVPTYWNGEPVKARRVKVKVGSVEKPTYWYAGLVGTIRKAVEITPGRPSEVLENPDGADGQPFFIDDESGAGWLKVTKGMGSPQWGHSSLPADSEVVEVIE